MIWFTSDLHFSHRGVIDYCKRPYKDITEMNKALIEIWNDTVNEGDTVYVLGDFSLNKKWSGEIVPILKGNKILIAGNHDQCFKWLPGHGKTGSEEGTNRRYKTMCETYISHGWQSIHQVLEVTLKNGRKVLCSHLPYAPKEKNFDQRYLEYRPEDKGLFQLHGHQHGHYRKHYNKIDVGIDGELKLWSEDEIIGMIDDSRDIIDTPITNFYKERKR